MKRDSTNAQDNNFTLGLILLVIGSVWLLKEMGIIFPVWMLSWPMVIIILGLIILIKHKFRSGFGFFILLLGTYFLIKREFHIPIDIGPYLIPVGLILLGIYLILNRRHNNHSGWKKGGVQENVFNRGIPDPGETPDDKNSSGNRPSKKNSSSGSATQNHDQGDFLHSEAFFCGVQKRMLSKSFRGGKISSIFGTTEIDLRQSDVADQAFLDVGIAFGGLKLIVPPHWDLQINVTNVFAGIEDKRIYPQVAPDLTKILSIKGTVFFGSIEIKSF